MLYNFLRYFISNERDMKGGNYKRDKKLKIKKIKEKIEKQSDAQRDDCVRSNFTHQKHSMAGCWFQIGNIFLYSYTECCCSFFIIDLKALTLIYIETK